MRREAIMDRTMEGNFNPRDEADGELENARPEKAKRLAMWRHVAGNRYAWGIAGAVLALIVAMAAIRQSQSSAHLAGIARTPAEIDALGELRQAAATSSNLEARPAPEAPEVETSEAKAITGPMIAQTASLTILPANYDRTAGSIDALVTAHGGYVQKLNSESRPDASRQVSLTLRVPVKQIDGFLADLRKLGRVEAESRENEEVTDQYVDLDARLQNARAGEQRLVQLLGTRTGKLEDVLDAERELTRVRGDIQSMTGERNLLVHRVEYATVELQLQEQYRVQLTSSSAGSLHNALVEGLRNLEEGAFGAVEFLLTYGPSMAFWLAIFGIPGWLAWRGARRRFSAQQ
jgi:hypothetical protein